MRAWIAIGVAIALCGTLALPWAASGTRTRSGWSLAGSARRLGVVDGWAVEAILVGFFAIPALVALAWILASVHRPRAAAGALTVAIGVDAACAGAVIASPLPLRWGLVLNLVLCLSDLLVVGWTLTAPGASRERPAPEPA